MNNFEQIKLGQEPKFYKYFKQHDFKYPPKMFQSIRQHLNTQIVKVNLLNPFTNKELPKYNKDQLPSVIMFMGRQMDEMTIRNFCFPYLQQFICVYQKELIEILFAQELCCDVFCLAICRYLLEFIKTNQLSLLVQKIKTTSIVDLLLSVFQRLRLQYHSKGKDSKHKGQKKSHLPLFQALIAFASLKYIKQSNEQDRDDYGYIERAIRVSIIAIEQAQKQSQFEAVREFVQLTSHLLIFNKQDFKPIKFYEFCLELHQGISFQLDKQNQKIDPEYQKTFFYHVGLYIKNDRKYIDAMVKMVRNLLGLHIKSQMLFTHFQVLILMMRQKQFTNLKKKIYEILMETQDKKIQEFIDRIYVQLLASDPDLLTPQTQAFNLRLAETGEKKRKQKFVEIYFYCFTKNNKKLAPETTNFIIETYFEQKMELPQFDKFLNKEAAHIKDYTIKKLHSTISKEGKQSNLDLLSIILQKRLDLCLKKSKESIPAYHFVQEAWLEAAKNCSEIYQIYLKMIVDAIGAKTIDIKPKLINLNSCIIKVHIPQSQIQSNCYSFTLKYYQMILKEVTKYKVFNSIMFKYLIICQAIFGERMDITSHKYFSIFFKQITGDEEVNQIIFLLQYLVRLLKNKSSVLIYLQAILEFERSHANFYTKKLYDLQFLIRLVEQSKYFKISTYSIESLVLLNELSSLIGEESFYSNAKKIITLWSSQMNRIQCSNLSYLYSFREIKKIFPYIEEKEDKKGKQRISKLGNLVLELLDIQVEPEEFIQTLNNKISLQWRNSQMVKEGKNSAKLQLNILRNVNMDLNFQLTLITPTRVYTVEITNEKCLIYYKDGLQGNKYIVKQVTVKQLKKIPENIHFSTIIEGVFKNKFHLCLFIMGQPIEFNEEGSVMSIQFTSDSKSYLHNVVVTNTLTGDTIKKLANHLTVMKNIQVKIKSLAKIKLASLLYKFDFEQAYCVMGEMQKHFRQSNLMDGFKQFVRLSFRLFKYLSLATPHKNTPPEINIMRAIFSLVKNGFKNIKKSPTEISLKIQLQPPESYAYYLYYLYVSAFLPIDFWSFFSLQTKTYLIGVLSECLKTEEFKTSQNQNIELFEQLCQLVDQQEGVIEIINQIIVTHQDNSFLTLKFQHYIVMAQYSQKMTIHLTQLLEDLINCISSDNVECIRKKILCKFLIIETNILEIIFSCCSAKSKISLVHYIMYNTVNASFTNHKQQGKIKSLVQIMSKQERPQLIKLLIVELQIDSVPKIMKKRLSTSIRKSSIQVVEKFQTNLHTELYLLIKLWNHNDNETLEDSLSVLINFLKIRQNQNFPQDQILVQTENTICTQEYLSFLFSLKELKEQNLMKYEQDFNIIFQLSFSIISKSFKKKFLKFMNKYLEIASKNVKIALHPLKIEKLDELQLYSHSIILQYTYQMMMLMKYKNCFAKEEQMQVINAIIYYIQRFTVNLQFKTFIKKPLVYVYPRLIPYKESGNRGKALDRIRKMENVSNLELRGGIYFKLIIIVIELLSTRMDVDFSKFIQLLLLRKNPRKSSIRSSSDEKFPQGIQNSKTERTTLETQMLDIEEEHRMYFTEREQQLSKEGNEGQNDLSLCLFQFFLMRLCDFLQNHSGELVDEILKSYSSLILHELQNPKIAKEITSANQSTNYEILDYVDIQHIMGSIVGSKNEDSQHSGLSLNLSPPSKKGTMLAPINISNASYSNELVPSSPNKSSQQYRRKTFNPNDELKKISEMIEVLSKAPKHWSKYCKENKVVKSFNNKSKQIRFIELMHIHYVLNRSIKQEALQTFSKEAELRNLIMKHNTTLKLLNNRVDVSILQFSIRKVKKLYPYTSPNRTVLKIMQNCFYNMTSPITQHVSCKDYILKKIRYKQSLYENYYQESQIYEDPELNKHETSFKQHLTQVQIFEDQYIQSVEQMKQRNMYCELVTREGVYFCEWELSERQLRLKPKDQRPSYKTDQILIYGTPEDNLIKKNLVDKVILLDEIEQIFYRKFSQMYNSIQIFMLNGTSRFITFYTKQFLNAFMKFLQQIFKGLKVVKDPVKQFSQLNYTDRWVEGTLSNFDYLMLLNKYSGRTHNDVNQYYIFPWILKDYQSQKIDLTDFNIYRDLSKPMGALNPQKLKKFRDIFKINAGGHYYGSHYSTSLFVLYYLVRLQPFTTLHRDMQKGFDCADRLFSSIYQVWETLMSESSTSDIKQLIPQFYYMPAFLKNVGNIEFGQKMCGEDVNDVVLPPWASSAQQFIITLRAALQSDWVSENLHLWIDLIFGKHQCSEQKHNIFLPITYQQKLQPKWKELMQQPEDLKATIDQITYFGQCPSKLFTKEHKPKNRAPEILRNVRASVKKGQSNTTSSQAHFQQAQILMGWKFIHTCTENNKFFIELESLNGKKQVMEAVIDSLATFQELKQSLEDLKQVSKKRTDSWLKQQQNKIKLHKSQLKIGKQVIMALEMNFSFEKIKVNQIWIVCYGLNGLRAYNWQQQLQYKWEKEEVSFVHLQHSRLIFSTQSGKVCFYSFFDARLHQTNAFKQCSSMEIVVIPFARLPSRLYKNQIQYKILCIGDGKRVILIGHTFEQIYNHTSLANLH